MKVAVLTANLGNFDTPVDPVPQSMDYTFHRFTDEDFPPITGLTPRMQYRIPKTHGWQMFPGYDYYIWLDGSFSLPHEESVEWFIDQCGDMNMLLFKHPWRETVRQEVNHLENHLVRGKEYITRRYKNGLHKEQWAEIETDPSFVDDKLYTSTVFVYHNIPKVQRALQDWWYYGSRYFTCDQVVLPYIVHRHGLRVHELEENQYKMPYLELVSRHS